MTETCTHELHVTQLKNTACSLARDPDSIPTQRVILIQLEVSPSAIHMHHYGNMLAGLFSKQVLSFTVDGHPCGRY